MRQFRTIAVAAVLLALTAGTAAAQGRGRGRGREGAPGQVKKAERQEEARFADRDRESAHNWYAHARRDGNLPPGLRGRELPPGLRDRDRLPPGLEGRLQPGYVLDSDVRPQVYPIPPELERNFAPPPPNYRYGALGGHILLIDAAFRIADVMQLRVGIAR